MLVASSTVVAMAPATAVTSPNPVVVENQQPGSTGWQIPAAGYQIGDDSSGQVKGYASATSVNKGDSIAFNISVNPPQAVTLTVYRLGWYGGSGGRLVTTLGPFNGITQPPCPE